MSKKENTLIPENLTEKGHDVWLAGLGALATIEAEGTKLYERLKQEGEKWIEKGSDLLESNDLLERGKAFEARGRKKIEDVVADLTEKPKEISTAVREKFSAPVEKTVDVAEDALVNVLNRMNVPTRTEVEALTAKVETLTQKVEKLATSLNKKAPARKASARKTAAKK